MESTLHSLWEERRILFVDYDRIMKRSWTAASPTGPGAGESQVGKRELHLFNKLMEQQQLERRIAALYNALLGSYAKDQFARTAAALDGKEVPKSTVDVPARKREIKKLVVILEDLLKQNPDLPPSPALQMDWSVLDSLDSPPARFKSVGGSL